MSNRVENFANLASAISQLKWEVFQDHSHPLITMDDFDSASRGPWGSVQLIFKVDNDHLRTDANSWWNHFLSVFRWRLR